MGLLYTENKALNRALLSLRRHTVPFEQRVCIMAYLSGYGVHEFASFAVDMEAHQRSSDSFFTGRLLKILEEDFAILHACITAHDGKKLLGVIGNNHVKRLARYYSDKFHTKDMVSEFITSHQGDLMESPAPVVHATGLVPAERYRDTEYSSFLGQVGLAWAVVLVFPHHRVGLFREVGEPDFTLDELHRVGDIYKLIASKYETHALTKNRDRLSDARRDEMDRKGVGVLAFTDKGSLVECNRCAVQYCGKLFGRAPLHNTLADILALLGDVETDTAPRVAVYRAHRITLKSVCERDDFGVVSRLHYATIEPLPGGGSPAGSAAPGALFASLSAREEEVLAAFCTGASQRDISKSLYISINTVRSHMKSIYQKLNVTNQRELMQLHYRHISQK